MATACPRRPPVDVGAVCGHDARQEPGAVVTYAGICGGGGQQWPSLLRLRSPPKRGSPRGVGSEARAEQRLAAGGAAPHNPDNVKASGGEAKRLRGGVGDLAADG